MTNTSFLNIRKIFTLSYQMQGENKAKAQLELTLANIVSENKKRLLQVYQEQQKVKGKD